MSRFVLRAALLFASAFSSSFACLADDDPVAMVVDLLARDDAEFRSIGLDRIRHAVKGAAATQRFAALLPTLPADRQIALVRALADRGDAAAIPAITSLLGVVRDPLVRAAAVESLGGLGGGAEVAVLKKSLSAADPEKSAARRALTIIRGDEATNQLTAAAKSGEPATRVVLIDVLADRRSRAALPDLLAATTAAEADVRASAVRALGRLGGTAELPGLVNAFLKAAPGGDRDEAERAIVAVCTQNPGHDRSAAAFLETFKAKADVDRESLLSPLGRIGGPGALTIVDSLINDPDTAKRALGLKAITRWPDATVSSRLLDLVGKAQNPAERDLLVGALIRIAPLPDNKLDDRKKLDLVRKIMPLCQTDAERARLLERANAIRTIETFRFVTPYLDDPKLAEPACKSVVELAHHQKLRDANKDEVTKALDKVIGTTKNSELVERATRYKEGKTWERKKG